MGRIKDLIENITETIIAITALVKTASAKAWSRIALMASVGILVMGSYLLYLTSLVDSYSKDNDKYLSEYNTLQKEIRAQQALDYLNVCIDAKKDADPNQDYYCKNAVTLYEKIFNGEINAQVQDNVKRLAYGAMKVETATKLRTISLERFDKNTPKMDKKLTFMLSNTGITIVCLLGTLAMALTVWLTYNMSKREQP